jgi:hypothetical protein
MIGKNDGSTIQLVMGRGGRLFAVPIRAGCREPFLAMNGHFYPSGFRPHSSSLRSPARLATIAIAITY